MCNGYVLLSPLPSVQLVFGGVRVEQTEQSLKPEIELQLSLGDSPKFIPHNSSLTLQSLQ